MGVFQYIPQIVGVKEGSRIWTAAQVDTFVVNIGTFAAVLTNNSQLANDLLLAEPSKSRVRS